MYKHYNLLDLRRYLILKLGLKYSVNQEKDLYERMAKAAKSFNFNDTYAFFDWLIKQSLDKVDTGKLASFLTVGETYFFREKKSFDYLEFHYLPRLIQSRKHSNKKLKIWSAGCSSGDEPYSIAILLKRIIPDIQNWDITILATDINSNFISKAKKGIYSNWSFRGLTERFKKTYFKKLAADKYCVNADIRKMVTFNYLNLKADKFPSIANNINEFDVIFCKNVLIYFSNKCIQKVTNKFSNTLTEGGVLLVSPVEVASIHSPKLARVFFNGGTIFVKKLKQNSSNLKSKDKFKIETLLSNNLLNNKTGSDLFNGKLDLKLDRLDFNDRQEEIAVNANVEPTILNKVETQDNYKEIVKQYKAFAFETAEQLAKEAIQNNATNNEDYYLLLARINADRGKLSKAVAYCEQAIQLDKVNIEAYYLLATILFEQKKDKNAIKALNSTLFLDSDFALGYFLLGIIFKKMGEKLVCDKYFDNALKSLKKVNKNVVLNEMEGITSGSLVDIINTIR